MTKLNFSILLICCFGLIGNAFWQNNIMNKLISVSEGEKLLLDECIDQRDKELEENQELIKSYQEQLRLCADSSNQ